MKQLVDILEKMKTNTVSNYVIAGLDSSLLNNGKVRYFESSRNHQDQVTPHSHRFDFTCLVVAGSVVNKTWIDAPEDDGDFFEESKLIYSGDIGSHTAHREGRGWWKFREEAYVSGECYNMQADQIHSIDFSRGAKVLFFEGPEISKSSRIIEPIVRGEVIRTYEKRDYMFKEIVTVRRE